MGRVVAVSGFFDPLHHGHIDYLKKAKALANEGDGEGTLWVIVNSDSQAADKKGKAFMPAAERVKMVRALRCVDAAMEAPDADSTVVKGIEAISPDVFAIGLDEGPDYMKEEREACRRLNIEVVMPLGARVQSSSWLIERAALAAAKKKEAEVSKQG
ncbi:Ethanolamine-phosphate cytidylyltransferase [Hondaea fermentalgiana]|uniref:Ethanolamine-phosphate cytidylyltransferase n=1 Tax=Hondaea fermentalgiana TaxID=2315210 RepID=A0A2R5GIN3_9STRA|nr:Ethanolamine-phosphate cytidylyltransferase [Hondaea fermentalgiana]|eukprot:GBG30752.1 Ethanolamine-phosphate cytidylyltransferase [Hondaea fermentalgiana]